MYRSLERIDIRWENSIVSNKGDKEERHVNHNQTGQNTQHVKWRIAPNTEKTLRGPQSFFGS